MKSSKINERVKEFQFKFHHRYDVTDALVIKIATIITTAANRKEGYKYIYAINCFKY